MEKGNKTSIFGVKLRMLREHQEFSQKEAAEQLNILPDTYSRYERGIREPNFQTLKHIANFSTCPLITCWTMKMILTLKLCLSWIFTVLL